MSISVQLVVGLAVMFGIMGLFIRYVWRKYTPRGLAFLCLGIFGMGLMSWTGQFASAPSSAPRVTASGRCERFQSIVHRYYTLSLFRLVLPDGSRIPLETTLTLTNVHGVRFIQDGELLQVKYLDKKVSGHSPEAIAIRILAGPNAGWHRSVDANWFGAWLMFPAGAIVCAYAAFRMMKNRRPLAPPSAEAENRPGMIDLGLR